MNTHLLKTLAQATFVEGKIDEKVAQFALLNLSNQDLKKYEFYVKQLLKQNTVRITSATELDSEMKKTIEQKLHGKTFAYEIDQKLGGGIVIEDNDNTLDASIKGLIHQTVKKVEEQL